MNPGPHGPEIWALLSTETDFAGFELGREHWACPELFGPITCAPITTRTATSKGLGDLRLSGLTPSGHLGTLMPEQMYFIDDSTASFEGVDLGRPVHFSENPKIGSVILPARGVLARGKAMWRIGDEGEFERRLQEAAS